MARVKGVTAFTAVIKGVEGRAEFSPETQLYEGCATMPDGEIYFEGRTIKGAVQSFERAVNHHRMTPGTARTGLSDVEKAALRKAGWRVGSTDEFLDEVCGPGTP